MGKKLTNKELFQKFSEEQKHVLPFCLQYNWWNEVVCDDWEVAILSNENQVFGIMPYYIRRKGPWTMLTNPHFTPYCGPFLIHPPDQKRATKIAYEHDAHKKLILQLPKYSEYSQNFHLGFTNSLAFKWDEFEDSNRYTYLLDLSQSEEDLWSGLRENNRRQIKKAEKTIRIEECTDAVLLEKMMASSFENKIESIYFERIVSYIQKYNCGKLWKAFDGEKNHAALLIIWDKQSAYYLIGGAAKEYKNSGAMSLLLWEAIKYSKSIGKNQFNFEGSSLPSIEKYFRGFGGELSSFMRITKKNSSSLQIVKKLKG